MQDVPMVVHFRWPNGKWLALANLQFIPRVGELVKVKQEWAALCDQQCEVLMVVYDLDNHLVDVHLKLTGQYA